MVPPRTPRVRLHPMKPAAAMCLQMAGRLARVAPEELTGPPAVREPATSSPQSPKQPTIKEPPWQKP
jgi:hypothetical protein